MTDLTHSIAIKMFAEEEKHLPDLQENIKVGQWLVVCRDAQFDPFSKDCPFNKASAKPRLRKKWTMPLKNAWSFIYMHR